MFVLKIDSSSVMMASQMEGQGDVLMLRAYKENMDARSRVDCLKQAAVCYNESCSIYQKASMRMFSKAMKKKTSDAIEALEFETRHRGAENPKLREVVGRLVRNKDFRARLGVKPKSG